MISIVQALYSLNSPLPLPVQYITFLALTRRFAVLSLDIYSIEVVQRADQYKSSVVYCIDLKQPN